MKPSPRENLEVSQAETGRSPSPIEKQIEFRNLINSPDPRFDSIDELAGEPEPEAENQ